MKFVFKFNKRLIDNNKNKKTIFEIHKISKKSQVYMREKFVLNNEFNTIYNRLKKFLETQQYEDIFNIKDDIRFILEKICSIFFDNTNNFTNNYNDLLNKINICNKYTANDIQDLNHGKSDFNNDEVISKVQFVTEIIDRIRGTN